MNEMADRARLIAFYLPQFHPIPENDEWWGKGFTEWTNVAKAKPLFKGHEQPHLPADLGFYDLRVPEVREAQAALARQHGIHGFCYWHYWFQGRRLLNRPFDEVLASGHPNFPFCLGWANESWSGIWHGSPDRILIEQTYPGKADYEKHFEALLPAFRDARYITVEGKPLFVVYKPMKLPNPLEFTSLWNQLALKAGLEGFFFVGIAHRWIPREHGFDAVMTPAPATQVRNFPKTTGRKLTDRVMTRVFRKDTESLIGEWRDKPTVRDYKSFVNHTCNGSLTDDEFPVVLPNWDNTPRSGSNGLVLKNCHPKLFGTLLQKALKQVQSRSPERRIIFLKSWNEWAEGNYLEPDCKHGLTYLQTIKDTLLEFDRVEEKEEAFISAKQYASSLPY
jgi:hypothetical protein